MKLKVKDGKKVKDGCSGINGEGMRGGMSRNKRRMKGHEAQGEILSRESEWMFVQVKLREERTRERLEILVEGT